MGNSPEDGKMLMWYYFAGGHRGWVRPRTSRHYHWRLLTRWGWW